VRTLTNAAVILLRRAGVPAIMDKITRLHRGREDRAGVWNVAKRKPSLRAECVNRSAVTENLHLR
jgi:hypothetical protein